jgi:2-iminobutanoate/2-iminopropanoate deaminase
MMGFASAQPIALNMFENRSVNSMQKSKVMFCLSLLSVVTLVSLLPEKCESAEFKKENFNYSEWTKGKFSEVVTVTNPGKMIFVAGIGAEDEDGGKIVEQSSFVKIKKLLEKHGATMNDVVRIVTYVSDIRDFQDALKCRKSAFGDAPIPASTLINVSQFAWPNMKIEIDVTAILPN